MTREEAIENITEIKKCEAGVYAEALELAIKALEQEPCIDLEELRHRFGSDVASVVEDMIKGTDKRWSCSEKPNRCGDAISRQAAIDAIENEQKKIMRSDWSIDQAKFSAMSEIRALIEALPSVSTEKTGQWIPVSEKLPEEDTYLICTDKGYIATVMYDRSVGWLISAKIIAYMPLPQPYTEESEE